MDSFTINGPNVLNGSIKVEGSKNAALPIIAGALLIDKGETIIRNVPPLKDIYTLSEMLRYIGAEINYDSDSQVMTVKASTITENTAPYELMSKMRASFLVLGPILSRLGEARISLPGGCSLGARPVDYHIKAFSALGASITEKGGYVIAKADKLIGGTIYFDRPSHTGTENIIYAAVMAKGRTQIVNAACDPEIVDLANFLNLAGAKISGAGNPHITIEPVKRLKAVEYSVEGDRLVAGTYMIGAAMTGGKVEITGLPAGQLTIVCQKLIEMGAKITEKKRTLTVAGPKKLSAVSATTFPYPGFPTDLQACLSAAACKAMGTSYIRETVFIDRFNYAMELRRLGADISVTGSEAIITGVDRLQGTSVMAPDIRAGAGLVLGCLAAKGRSEIRRVYHIDRGYYKLEDKLSSLGVDIKRIKS